MSDKVHDAAKWLTIENLTETVISGAATILGKAPQTTEIHNHYSSPNSANTGLENTIKNRVDGIDDEKKKSPLVWIVGGVVVLAALYFLLKK